jgi:hypothetical protein
VTKLFGDIAEVVRDSLSYSKYAKIANGIKFDADVLKSIYAIIKTCKLVINFKEKYINLME